MSFLGKLFGGGMTSPEPKAEFMGGGRYKGNLAQWRPPLRSAKDDVALAWDVAAGRAMDLVQNNGWIAGMFDQVVADTVGTGLRLKAAPENDLIGMSEAEARDWRKLVERRWELWAGTPAECDIEGKRTFGMMQEAGFRSYLSTGEILSESALRKRAGARLKTKVRLLPPQMLVNRTDKARRIFSGVQVDGDGQPVGYMRLKDDLGQFHDAEVVPARDRYGRPRVVHNFVGAPGAVRGISPLVPVLRVAKRFDQLADSTLTAALIQSIFAANIKSPEITRDAMAGLMTPAEQSRMAAENRPLIDAWFETNEQWYEDNQIDLGVAGRVVHTFPGQELEFLSPSHPASAYDAFSRNLLAEMARCLGLTFEGATGDYRNASYATIRAATTTVWPIVMMRRKFIVAPFCQAHYEAWLEEEIQNGTIWFPGGLAGFLENRTAACRAEWKGPPKPEAEILKTAKAAEVVDGLGLAPRQTLAEWFSDMDFEDVQAMRADEKAMVESYGLTYERANGPSYLGSASPRQEEDDG